MWAKIKGLTNNYYILVLMPYPQVVLEPKHCYLCIPLASMTLILPKHVHNMDFLI